MSVYEYQDLQKFKVPADFRGRPGWFVQLWWICQSLFFHPSPQVFYSWRRFLLRAFGARIGRNVIIRPSVRVTYPWKLIIGDHAWVGDNVELYTLGEISIGANAVVSQGSYLCTGSHDYLKDDFPIYQKPINIAPEAWVASQVFIGPGVNVGYAAVIGARSVVLKDIQPLSVGAGHPYKMHRQRK
jgi:putative colanic acid biosynthesis acetyltransferase WcaF